LKVESQPRNFLPPQKLIRKIRKFAYLSAYLGKSQVVKLWAIVPLALLVGLRVILPLAISLNNSFGRKILNFSEVEYFLPPQKLIRKIRKFPYLSAYLGKSQLFKLRQTN